MSGQQLYQPMALFCTFLLRNYAVLQMHHGTMLQLGHPVARGQGELFGVFFLPADLPWFISSVRFSDSSTKLYGWKTVISSKESVVRRPHFLELGLVCVCTGAEGGKHTVFLEVFLCTQKINKSTVRQLLSGSEYVE